MRKIVAATEENKEEILKLYKIQLGREFCPWDDSYPGMKEIEFDLGRESLFVMIDGQEINADAGSKEDRIIAAISIDDDPQVERLDCWSHKLAPGAFKTCGSSGFSESENCETNAGIWDGRARKERIQKCAFFSQQAQCEGSALVCSVWI